MTDHPQQEPTTTAPDAVTEAVVPEAVSVADSPAPTRLGASTIGEPPWDPQPGDVVRVHLRIKEITKKGEEKERLQAFEGTVIARRHGSEPGATFTVRKIATGGFGVERIFPLHAPTIARVDVVKRIRVRRAKLHYLRRPLKKGKKLQEVAA